MALLSALDQKAVIAEFCSNISAKRASFNVKKDPMNDVLSFIDKALDDMMKALDKDWPASSKLGFTEPLKAELVERVARKRREAING